MPGIVALINVGALVVFAIGVWLITRRERLPGGILVFLALGMILGFWAVFSWIPEPM